MQGLWLQLAVRRGSHVPGGSAAIAFGASALLAVWLMMPQSATPVYSATDAKAHGAELFATKGCAHCHGAEGVGGGLGPDLQLVSKRMDAARIFQQIHDGGMAMPAFGDQLTEPEIDDLVVFLRARRKYVRVPARPVEPSSPKPEAKDPD